MHKSTRSLKEHLLDLLFPRFCLRCEQLIATADRQYICEVCLALIKLNDDTHCAFCSAPVIDGEICPFCRKDHYLDRLFSATSYDEPTINKAIKLLKYRFVSKVASDLSVIMIRYAESKLLPSLSCHRQDIIVIPVPLHWQRYNWRGFNQAELLAQGIAEYFQLACDTTTLKRTSQKKPQVEIEDRESRIKNMQGMFVCAPKSPSESPSAKKAKNKDTSFHSLISDDTLTTSNVFANKTVLLIDDVSTTASTLNDCARALKDAGAKKVIGFVLARAK